MAFLKLNGITVPVSAKDTKGKRIVIGDRGRSLAGRVLETRQSEPRTWQMSTVTRSQQESKALEGMLFGDGHHFSFDTDLYSELKGLGPSSGTGTITASGQYGSYLALSAVQQVVWPTGRLEEAGGVGSYTIMIFEGVGVWTHYIIVRQEDGTINKWVDGVSNDAASTPFVGVDSSGDLFVGDAANAYEVDDLVFMPYAVPTSWIAGLYAEHSTRAWPNMPQMRLDGEVVYDHYTTVESDPDSIQTTVNAAPFNGSWDKVAQEVAFSIEEV